MKYCVSGRQSAKVLEKADEIKVKFQDIDGIANFIREHPNKTIIYEIPNGKTVEEIEWKKLKAYASDAKIKLALGNIKLANECFLNHLDYYWAFPITTYYELEGIVNQGVCELLIAAPLTFDLERVSKENLPIRVVANLAYDNYIPRADGIKGFYIRPEDVETYEKYISTIEFAVDDLSKESTLLHVYKDNKEWPGNLNLLLTNLNFNIDNRSIPDDFAEVRMNCQQRCMRNKNCHFCDSAFLFGDQVRKEANARRKDH